MSSISSTAAPAPKMPGSRKQLLPQKWNGRAVFNVEELAEILRTNPWTIYEAIKRKEIFGRSHWPGDQDHAPGRRGNVGSLKSYGEGSRGPRRLFYSRGLAAQAIAAMKRHEA
jgi:hypothetical protein